MSEERSATYRVKDVGFYSSPFFRRLKATLPADRLTTALVLCDWAILRGGRLGATPNPGLGDFGMTFRVADIHGLVSAVSAAGLFRFDEATGWLWLPSGVRWQNVSWMLKSRTPEWAPSSASPNAIKAGATQWQGLWRDIDELLSGDFPFKAEFVRENADGLFLAVAAQRCPAISAALSGLTESAHWVEPLGGATGWDHSPRSGATKCDYAVEPLSGPKYVNGVRHSVPHEVEPLGGFPRSQESGVIKKEGPAREPAPARESIEGTMSISRSQLEAEIAESQAVRDSEPKPKPLVAAGPLHPGTPAKTVDELLEGIEFPGAFDNVGDPMPELPSMKSVDRRPLAERLPEMFGGLNLDVPPERLAEAEAYDASRKASAEAKAASMDPEDAAFEEALATFMEMYKLDERVKKVMGRSISEIPQGLEAHHDACRKAAKTIANRYSKSVGAPVVGQASAAIMRAVLMLVEDGRISVPGAVDRLMNMLDWWEAPDGNPKRRSDDGKDWFADATAVFGGKETLQSSAGSPRDAGVIIMAGLNASAAWKHARERKLDASKDPFAATGTETYYGIGEALKRGDWGVKQ